MAGTWKWRYLLLPCNAHAVSLLCNRLRLPPLLLSSPITSTRAICFASSSSSSSSSPSSFITTNRPLLPSTSTIKKPTSSPPPPRRFHSRLFSSSEPTRINTKVNFSLGDSDAEDNDDENKKTTPKEIDKSKLPPPYDPFNKKPVIEEPEDPKDLQEIFHNMRNDGLLNNAVKMFDALSKDGLTHEALELFAQIKDKGHMPDVVAHTAVVEAYANAGQSKDALKVFMRMLASGVTPNAYTYTVLIKGLAADPKYLGDAKKYLLELMGKGMRPNAGAYTAVFEAFAKEQKVEDAEKFLEQMKAKGFKPDEKAVKEVLNNKRGPVFRTVMNILFGK
ncbi:hypothetical protein FEM48_Zijuj02G0120800 [Ziziphus jujuba var. spinosa]|uniref:Pentatricopeptide repeat-containing protein At4g38150-like n=1 Tax=Ziziphus jujuba var. spinosa TaxID=714518 RepID=A0A978VVM2_ZIZJJ|nr:hypothetical protein FEM48_Zijuj02G0120800 [Ziziphus jujuba var. spinosa]